MRLLTKTSLYIVTLSLFLFFIMGIVFFQVLKNMSLSDLDNDLEAMSELVDTQVRDDPFAISLQIPGLDSLSIQPVSS